MASTGRTVTGLGALVDVRWPAGSRRLAARAAEGDERAFAAIFERHHQELYRYCLSILRSPADAEDAMQSAMTKALRALPGEERQIHLRPWLFRIAHNEAISLLRARRATDQAAVPEALAGGLEPAQELEQKERLRALVEDLNQLPERQRGALVMRELSGLSYEEIGAALDCGDGAARQTVYEARIALQLREEGRQMECAEVRQALSAGDRRRLRGRAIKAHLTGCEGCRDFNTAIQVRRRDLSVLAPPLGIASSAAILGGLLGGTGAGVGAGAAGAGATATVGGISGAVGGLTAAKGASLVAAVAIAAGGAGQATGIVDLPNPLGGSDPTTPAPAAGGGAAVEPGDGPAGGAAEGAERPLGDAGKSSAAKNGRGKQGKAGGRDGAASNGKSGEAPGAATSEAAKAKPNGSDGVTGPPADSNAGGNGNGNGVPGGGGSSSNAGGNSATAPGQTKVAPPTPNAGGNSGSPGGSSDTAPGQTGIPPASSNAGGNGKKPADTP